MKKFVFVHIPKTGGTTLKHVLKAAYNGHMKHDTFFRRERGRNKFITLCKDSEKFKHKPKPKHRLFFGHFTYYKYRHLGWEFATFLREPIERVISYYNVWSMKYPKAGILEFAAITPNFMHYMTGGDLSKFAFVGLTEHYDESVERLGEVMDVQMPKIYKWYSYHADKPEIKRDELRALQAMNQKDIKLYNQAIKLFEGG